MLPDALGVRLNIGGYACNLGQRSYAHFSMPDMAGSHIAGSPLYICLQFMLPLRFPFVNEVLSDLHKHMRFYALPEELLPPAKTFPLPEGVLRVL